MEVVVGLVGRAHGIRGEVGVDVRTDEPERRFGPGTRLLTAPESVGPLTVERARWYGTKLLMSFAEIHDRTAAEALRGVRLLVEVDDDERPADPDEYYDRQLVGLAVQDVAGSLLGSVRGLLHLPGQDLLAVVAADGREVLVPFVTALVTDVDVAGGRVVVDPPRGLFDAVED